jgi:glutamine---fructose-6-phosphate transaminase (isomerizing)
MCGIFGFVVPAGSPFDNERLARAVRALLELSEPRGSEATGVALVLPHEVAIYKKPLPPRSVLAHPSFREFMDRALPAGGARTEIAAIGHCRLATNGTQISNANNQPVVTTRLVGVHNGIVTNTPARSGALDTEVLFSRIEQDYTRRGDLPAALSGAFSEIEGEASIALYVPEARSTVLATNTGSVYYQRLPGPGGLVFASERAIVERFLASDAGAGFRRPGAPVEHLGAGHALAASLEGGEPAVFALDGKGPTLEHRDAPPPKMVDRSEPREPLRRCSRCILPASYPFIRFDAEGACNYCRDHAPQKPEGRDALLRELERHRKKDGSPDCIVAFSGGRDSSYGLHLLRTELGMTPLAFTFDWGLVTDLARRNQARLCGKLGIEHVIRAADIQAQRRFVRQNVLAWLERPRLGMLPLFMAGDKFFYQHARELRRETGIELVVFCAGNELERTSFKTGFAGVFENNFKNRLFALDAVKKLELFAYYAREIAANPRYLNASLLNSARAFRSTFVDKDDFLYLYDYEPWDEATIVSTLVERYNWETGSHPNTWRIGDGYTAFINYIYFRVAGFSEFDVFRANQVREGLLGREQALRLAAEDNQPRWDELQEFARVVGLPLEEVLGRIDQIEPLGPWA